MANIFKCLAVSAAICGVVTGPALAMGLAYRVAYSFRAAGDGGMPAAGMVMDSTGALYGTTLAGGMGGSLTGHGTVFRFDPAREALTVLHQFTPQDGNAPFGRLALGPNGHLYGTLALGGAQRCGSVYDLNTATLAYTTLFSFSCRLDGGKPLSGVVVDESGILYGETSAGGANAAGTIFSLNPVGHVMTVLHSFSGGAGGDGVGGQKLLVAGGALYGGTCVPGSGPGFVFKLAPATGAMQIVYQFSGGADGYCPGALVAGPGSTLFGATQYSGGMEPPGGAIFKLDVTTGQLNVLHRFQSVEGSPPTDLTAGPGGNLFGARRKGLFSPDGSTFRLNSVTGAYRELDNLRARKAFLVADPNPGLVVDGTAVYGTTATGGIAGQGSIFEIIQ